MKFDMHMHTNRYSHDSQMDVYALLKRAKEIGLDGIVITEHDVLWPEHEIEELRQRQPDLIIMAGVEISARDGDVLCYGVREMGSLRRGMGWVDLCTEVHRQGGVAVAAHPYRWGQHFDRILEYQKPPIDGVEMMSNNMDSTLREQASEFISKNPDYATLGNSDAHEVGVVGCCYSEFSVPVRNLEELVAAIRARQVRPVVRTGRR
jgi:predicted metal-dependent phosphoesterase TrpH